MPTQHDEDLIDQCLAPIVALALEAAEGANLKTKVQIAVGEALDRFATGSNRDANMTAFRWRLKLMAANTPENDVVRIVFEDAASAIPSGQGDQAE